MALLPSCDTFRPPGPRNLNPTSRVKPAIKILSIAPAVVLACAIGRLGASPLPRDGAGGEGGASVGPDVIVGSLQNIFSYGGVGGIAAFAVGTVSCNIGDDILLWCDSAVAGFCAAKDHPVIAQNMYRLHNGRIEQIGMSWLKHGFCALDDTLCGSCTPDNYFCDALGVGCSDPYDASLNGVQPILGPRSQVNASTGVFPYPFTAPSYQAVIGRRLQVPTAALDPSQNDGALYFVEAHYVTSDDAAAGNANNNASYRQMLVGLPSGGGYGVTVTGGTYTQRHAIHAWRDHGLGMDTPDPSVTITNVDVAGDGRFVVGCKVTDNANGTWSYEYAILNQNSDRSARSWSLPLPEGVTVSEAGQTIINHHSGEPYSTAPWTHSALGGAATWSTDFHAVDANANALRWSTMFNFRFVADTPPMEGQATLGLFKPGDAADPLVAVRVPAPPEPACAADLTGSGVVDGADLAVVLGAWGTADPAIDLDGSGLVDGGDIAIVLGSWGDC